MLKPQALFKKDPKRLTKSQRKVVEFVLDRPQDAVFMSAAELAVRLGLSDATVVRVCQSLGFNGLTDFKEHLRRVLFQGQDTVSRLERTVGHSSSVQELVVAVMQKDLENLTRTMQAGPGKGVSVAAKMLAKAPETAIIGLRSAHSLAQFMGSSLRFLGRRVHQLSPGIGYVWAETRALDPSAVLVAISYPRYTSLTVQVAEEAHNAGIKVIAITDSELSPLARHADVVLSAACSMGSFMESFTAPLSLINALVTAVAYLDGQNSLDHLRKLERIWEEKGVYLHSETQ